MKFNENNKRNYDFTEELKKRLDEKVDKEFNNFITELINCRPQVILERAYEKVAKEEIVYLIKNKEYTITEIKALLKANCILDECYDEWLKFDGNFNELLDFAVEKRITSIVDKFKENMKRKEESR